MQYTALFYQITNQRVRELLPLICSSTCSQKVVLCTTTTTATLDMGLNANYWNICNGCSVNFSHELYCMFALSRRRLCCKMSSVVSWISALCFPSEPVQCQKPCKNGGVCVGLNRCRCAKGFTGSLCETGWFVCVCVHVRDLCLHFALKLLLCAVSVAVTTPCVPPCQHGATCSPHNTCTCPEGTTGLRCERLWVWTTRTTAKHRVTNNTKHVNFSLYKWACSSRSGNRWSSLLCIGTHPLFPLMSPIVNT